jgi:hypothetical protein
MKSDKAYFVSPAIRRRRPHAAARSERRRHHRLTGRTSRPIKEGARHLHIENYRKSE